MELIVVRFIGISMIIVLTCILHSHFVSTPSRRISVFDLGDVNGMQSQWMPLQILSKHVSRKSHVAVYPLSLRMYI